MTVSFLFFLAMFTAIGVTSAFKSRGTKKDYYLASGNVAPWMVGLSAVATNNSGYMFIGVIGYTYTTGLASIWLMVGWITGDFLASIYVHARLCKATKDTGEVSYSGLLANWYGNGHDGVQRLLGIISLIFLLAYASAQLVAGSKALHVLFGWPLSVGAIVGAVLVAVYCLAGGIRASMWTDAAQSFVMFIAMGILLTVTYNALGGSNAIILEMSKIDGYLNWYPQDLVFPGIAGGVLFALSWMFAGLSVIGQPHIMVRFMTLNNVSHMRQARAWYYLWYIIFYAMATGVGLLSRIYLTDSASFDQELALPTMAMELLPPVLVGLILAGIFAATMSTADSLILSCSAALTHDILPQNIENTRSLKLATLMVTVAALLWALLNSQSVFGLVVMAWSGLASAFAPLLLGYAFDFRPSPAQQIIVAVTGLATALIWRWLGWHNAVYEGMPGIIVGFVLLFSMTRIAPSTKSEIATQPA